MAISPLLSCRQFAVPAYGVLCAQLFGQTCLDAAPCISLLDYARTMLEHLHDKVVKPSTSSLTKDSVQPNAIGVNS